MQVVDAARCFLPAGLRSVFPESLASLLRVPAYVRARQGQPISAGDDLLLCLDGAAQAFGAQFEEIVRFLRPEVARAPDAG
jgi:hypothetical protein